MTIKFTKTGEGIEKGDESLLFEFLDHELSESIKIDYKSKIKKDEYIGSIQTNQYLGEFLQPIEIKGRFKGTLISNDGKRINSKERADQLLRLKGRVVKLFIEGIKQLVFIENIILEIFNYYDIRFDIICTPQDIQNPIEPTEIERIVQRAFLFTQEDLNTDNKQILDNLGSKTLNLIDITNPKTPIEAKTVIDDIIKNQQSSLQAIKNYKQFILKEQQNIKAGTLDKAQLNQSTKDIKSYQNAISTLENAISEYAEEGVGISKKFNLPIDNRLYENMSSKK